MWKCFNLQSITAILTYTPIHNHSNVLKLWCMNLETGLFQEICRLTNSIQFKCFYCLLYREYIGDYMYNSLQWRHYDHDCVSNHRPRGCLLNRLFRRRSKKTSKLHVTGLCVGNSPGPVNSPHKVPATRKMFRFDDVIMKEATTTALRATYTANKMTYTVNTKVSGCYIDGLRPGLTILWTEAFIDIFQNFTNHMCVIVAIIHW